MVISSGQKVYSCSRKKRVQFWRDNSADKDNNVGPVNPAEGKVMDRT